MLPKVYIHTIPQYYTKTAGEPASSNPSDWIIPAQENHSAPPHDIESRSLFLNEPRELSPGSELRDPIGGKPSRHDHLGKKKRKKFFRCEMVDAWGNFG